MKVLDASAWLDVLTAGLLIDGLADEELVVPPHFDAEVVGSLRGLGQRGALSVAAAETVLRRHLTAPFVRI